MKGRQMDGAEESLKRFLVLAGCMESPLSGHEWQGLLEA